MYYNSSNYDSTRFRPFQSVSDYKDTSFLLSNVVTVSLNLLRFDLVETCFIPRMDFNTFHCFLWESIFFISRHPLILELR